MRQIFGVLSSYAVGPSVQFYSCIMMFPILIMVLVIMLASALVWLVVQHRKRSRFWAERGVPHSPPHPILGNLDFAFKKNVGIWLRDLHEKFSSPFVGIWVFWQPVLVVSDPDVARRILLADSDLFRNRYLGGGKSDPIGSLNIFTLKEPMWSDVRRRITYIFTAAKLKSMHWLVLSKAKAIIDRIKQDKERNKITEIRPLFTDFSTDIIGTFAFGFENDSVGTGDSPLRAVTREFMKFNLLRGFAWYSVFFWPALVDIFRLKMFPTKSVEFFRKSVSQVIEHRIVSQIKNNDFLDALIKMKREGINEGREFSDDLLAAQAVIMLQGGFDTTAVAVTFLTYELAHKPEIQEKLYKELIEAKENNGGADFNFNDLEQLTYLNCCIKEVTRKYPPMGWLDRIAAVDYPITEDLTLPAGTPVYINSMAMHYDPKYYPEPYDFNPDRFLDEKDRDIVPPYYPFGDGPRMCIGKRFAQMTMRYLISELVLNLKFRPLPGYPKPNDVPIESKAMFLTPEESLSVDFVFRE